MNASSSLTNRAPAVARRNRRPGGRQAAASLQDGAATRSPVAVMTRPALRRTWGQAARPPLGEGINVAAWVYLVRPVRARSESCRPAGRNPSSGVYTHVHIPDTRSVVGSPAAEEERVAGGGREPD